ncbi:DNA-dependent RNA polymerase subunit rpo19 [Salmon gill poxvirus]|uniref:DNA-directed RNA polymerase 19 kDa subunit n=1 Tax=Salmon gill poxvirus TaxID=1680908 RepID=A0A0H4Y1D2_9POXV|nr:DNA-dependent RNA polymerase subunit rpo19 [Salmon gill poxvirus]AKR04227.1 DNA-dependent RNA polymerase subunit rpo19 [Salmon gill poxvirus]
MDDYSANDVFSSDDDMYEDENDLSISSEEEVDDSSDVVDGIIPTDPDMSIIDEVSETNHVEVEAMSKYDIIMKNYIINRLGIFELTGILAHRHNQLEKGSIPLFPITEEYYKHNSTWDAVVEEIILEKCPIVISKMNYNLKLSDYPREQVLYRLEECVNMWNVQNKPIKTFSYFKQKHNI